MERSKWVQHAAVQGGDEYTLENQGHGGGCGEGEECLEVGGKTVLNLFIILFMMNLGG